MFKQSESCNKIASTMLLSFAGILSACGSGGSSSTNPNVTGPTLALFAGNMGGAGTADGTGAAARFNFPGSVATDSNGNVYVADSSNNTIRKITPGKVVTTLAGTAGVTGFDDGLGAAASFDLPSGIATDSAGNIYVADQNNNTIRKITSAGVVSTLAGSANDPPGSADGIGAAARFKFPTGVVVDSANNVYVADSSNHTIRKITPFGEVTTLTGTAGASGNADATGAAARFSYPSGIATDVADNIYVADSNNNTIRKIITATGAVSTLAGTGLAGSDDTAAGVAASFDSPSGVATDSTGNVYVTDSYNNTIRKISTSTAGVVTVTTLAGSALDPAGSANGTGTAASFSYPSGIATDSNGNVYVADQNNNIIRKITPAGVVSTWAGTAMVTGSADGTVLVATFDSPGGVATDSSGNVYVADQNNSTIRKISTLGVVTTLAGTAGVIGSTDTTGGAPSFNNPTGVATDSAGNVYVADSGNHTIRKITPDGVVSTLAGSVGVAGSDNGDGVTTVASFNNPTGVATDSVGNVYVADQNNHTIRKITSAGVVSTVVGVAGKPGFTPGALPGLLHYPLRVALGGTLLYILTGGGVVVVKNLP